MEQDGHHALAEVFVTVEGLITFLDALEARHGVRDPRFEEVRKKLDAVADCVRGTIDAPAGPLARVSLR
ncbi:hypothetical protein SAMN05444722_0679 [Rhodovulum sp. ES.010]|uniref:hypothetical protein n=1 Tax=Rhodovulum sp. ES.010 TaxID=1882821 RepID=UPI00092AB36C|nr:hypothetical protein [Rhodovulum sp. ES.010]SIO16728.1 hypothetical protein SAMN05444722_0679 [Rhodovulum sp. ES.010]